VKNLLKDYPELVAEFGALMKIETASASGGGAMSAESYRISRDIEAEMEFIKMFEVSKKRLF